MKKIRITLSRLFFVIVIATIIIVILESGGIFYIARQKVETIIPFFGGKRELLCNIFIGIWGSAFVTLIGEAAEYHVVKKEYEMDIIYKFDEILTCIMKNEVIVKSLYDLYPLAEVLENDLTEVRELYHGYLPYKRKNKYVEIAKCMWEYINNICGNVTDLKQAENQLVYWSKVKKRYIRDGRDVERIDNLIQLYTEKKMRLLDEKYILDSIIKEKSYMNELHLWVISKKIMIRTSKKNIRNIDDNEKDKGMMKKLKKTVVLKNS